MEIVCKNLLAAFMIGVVDLDTVLPWQTPLTQFDAEAGQSEGFTQPVDIRNSILSKRKGLHLNLRKILFLHLVHHCQHVNGNWFMPLHLLSLSQNICVNGNLFQNKCGQHISLCP